jgi:hypothetical protein
MAATLAAAYFLTDFERMSSGLLAFPHTILEEPLD